MFAIPVARATAFIDPLLGFRAEAERLNAEANGPVGPDPYGIDVCHWNYFGQLRHRETLRASLCAPAMGMPTVCIAGDERGGGGAHSGRPAQY